MCGRNTKECLTTIGLLAVNLQIENLKQKKAAWPEPCDLEICFVWLHSCKCAAQTF